MALVAEGIIKSYGQWMVLSDVFLSCSPGGVVGLLGRNGSGKSTLLKIIFGSLAADNRHVVVDGCLMRHSWEVRGIKYLPQDDFFPRGVKLATITELFCTRRGRDAIREIDIIRPLWKKTSNEMSAGERRLAEILLILYSDARYVMLDEPFNGVSPLHKDFIRRAIQEQSSGKGIIITDHDYRSILSVATKVVLLHDGGTKWIKQEDELVRWGYLNG